MHIVLTIDIMTKKKLPKYSLAIYFSKKKSTFSVVCISDHLRLNVINGDLQIKSKELYVELG